MFTPQAVKPPTSADVAAAAGVSRATVSFVLNDKPNSRISEDTRRRVLAVAQRLSYSPNPTARSLATNAVSGTVVAGARFDYGRGLQRAVELWVEEQVDEGVDVVRDAGVEASGPEAASLWARIRPERVLAPAERCDEAATDVLRQAGVRALLLYGDRAVAHAPSLVLQQEAYGRLAASHLLERGHRALCFLVPADTVGVAAERVEAARRAAVTAGARLRVLPAAPTSDSVRDWAAGWRYDPDRPTGVIAFDDDLAIAAIRALRDAGVWVPRDVSVVGADDHEAGREFVPRLTTVAFDAPALARSIGAGYAAMLAGDRVGEITGPPLELRPRESTAAPPA